MVCEVPRLKSLQLVHLNN